MGKGYRAGRLGEEIRKIVSELLLRELKDPRFNKGIVSISGVDVTEDGSYATLYITASGIGSQPELTQEEKEDILAAFRSAKGRIRSEISKQIKLRHTPELLFKLDTSLDYGQKIEKIIHELGLDSDQKEEDTQADEHEEDED